MKPFAFRLDRILEYRRYLERRAQAALVGARQAHARDTHEVERLGRERRTVAAQCGAEGARGMEVASYHIYLRYLQTLEGALRQANDQAAASAAKVATREADVRAKMIAKNTLDTLRDKEWQQYLAATQREEQKILDELVIRNKEQGP